MSSVPLGILAGTFRELHEAGCIQTGADVNANVWEAAKDFGPLFEVLQKATYGNVCDGCPVFNKGNCSAFKKYHTSQQDIGTQRLVQHLHDQHFKSSIATTSAKRCPNCKLRIRGDNHDAHCKGKK